MTQETNREALARLYPLHYQRICEMVYKFSHADTWLNKPAKRYVLADAFMWGLTPEGFDYWERLERAED
jgi:hypothetical protein